MSLYFEELDYRPTPIGALSLRRRRELSLGVDVFEIKLGEDYLMSSLFTASEIALARLGLDELAGRNLDVVVGGLGLGHTARAVLEHAQVGSLLVVEALAAVIDWHRNGLVPLGAELTGDGRCRFVHGDFFALAESGAGFDPDAPGRCFDAVLVDIDHAPDLLLHPRNAAFYHAEGLQRLAAKLRAGGVLGLWIGGFIRSRGRCRLAARPQTPSDSSNHSTSPMGGGCLTLSAMSLGRDNRIARRYRNELFLRFFSEASEGFAPPRTRAGPRPQTRRRNPTPPFRTACPGCTYRDSLRQVWVIALQDELAVAIKSPASRLAEPKPGFR